MTTVDDSSVPPKPGSMDDQELVQEKTTVQVDAYGVKIQVPPVPDVSARPVSWREVASRTNKRLMSIALGLPEVIDDLLQGTRGFLRGLGALPGAVATKVKSAHAEADIREDQRQALAGGQPDATSPQTALEHIEKILKKKRIEGNGAGVIQREEGKVVFIFIGRPDLKEVLPELIEDTLKSLPGRVDEAQPREERDRGKHGDRGERAEGASVSSSGGSGFGSMADFFRTSQKKP